MKILYAAGSVIASESANSVHVMRMCEALAQAGHSVTLLAKAGQRSDAEVWAHYGVEPCFELARVPFRNRAGLLRYLQRGRALGRFDLLLGRYLYPLLALRDRAPRFCYEVHDAPTPPRWVLERLLLKDARCAGLITISAALTDHYRGLAGCPQDLAVLRLPDAAPAVAQPLPVRQQGALVAGYAGAFYAGRGLPLLLAVARQLPQIQFRVAGGDAAALAPYLAGDLPPNLECVGRLAPAAVPDFLRQCDVLLAPYERQVAVAGNTGNTADWCSPLKLFEYMAQGKAVMASELPALAEIIDHEQTGLLLPPDATAPWVAALQALDADRGRAQRLGHAALEAFAQRGSWQQRAERLLEHLAAPRPGAMR
jgi:glycosyltransferase involved in cell wall biosynthesis